MKLSHEALLAAIEGLESQKKKIDTQIAELRQGLNGGRTEAGITPRRRFSAAARRRMKAAQQRPWADVRGEKEPLAPASTEAPRRKRRLSAAGRKAIIAATKRRWARQRAEGAKGQPAASKKAASRKTRSRASGAKAE
jgi:hypothetical protein